MSFLSFLRGHALFLTVVSFLLVAWCVAAAFLGAVWILILFTVLAVLFGAGLYIGLSYYFFQKRMARLKRLQREMEEVYLLGEVLPRPENAVEEVYFSVMKAVSRAAIDRVSGLRRTLDDYLDYVEGWVHEIKTPLTACSLILANGGDVKKLKTELRRADNLAESVLFYARLRTAGTDVRVTKFSVRDAAEEAVKNEMELLLAAGVQVETAGDFTVACDRQAFVFSLKQLLVNCAKYCPGGHVKITAADGKLIVEDDGEGIPPHELPLVFARGFVGSAGRRRGGGTGMGLYLVKKTCEKSGVAVSAASEEGKYTRFTFTFAQGGEKAGQTADAGAPNI